MNIDYVIISSDDNKTYLDFYPLVSKVWKERIGLKVLFFHITDTESDFEENEFGLYKKVKAIDGIGSGLQSQCVRLYAGNYFKDKNLLISDIDMFPLNRDYFIDNAKKVGDDNIGIYVGNPHGGYPYYPMCYILGRGDVMTDCLGINDMSFPEFMSDLSKTYDNAWNTDENYFKDKVTAWDKSKTHVDKLHFKHGVRVSRSLTFKYEHMINTAVDYHSIRPYDKHKGGIDQLVTRLTSE